MPLLNTKLTNADAVCKTGQLARLNKVGRPSNANFQQMYEKRKKGPTKKTLQDIRKDGHLPYRQETDRSRCRYPAFRRKSYIMCTKCQIPLCLNKDKNCFLRFHAE
nr:unnamed protein product [Callosobruchus analis]